MITEIKYNLLFVINIFNFGLNQNYFVHILDTVFATIDIIDSALLNEQKKMWPTSTHTHSAFQRIRFV